VSGEGGLLTLGRQHLNNHLGKIAEFERKMGLEKMEEKHGGEITLDLKGINVAGLSAEGCDELALELASYSLFVQRKLNKERATLKWLDARINLTIAPELNTYGGYYSHEQRRAVAINGNSYAKELEEIKISTQSKVDFLENLPYQINQLHRTILEAKNTKINFNKR
jgi:hypothetical protein